MKINKVSKISGVISVPADKSITHRAVMLSCLSDGISRIDNYLNSEDCISTINAFRAMGVSVDIKGKSLIIKGAGIKGLKAPSAEINAGNSGTTTRIISGILAGQKFSTTIIGDDSLSKRPMKRIIEPLNNMGVKVEARDGNYLPMTIIPGTLKSADYISKIASAQVKSCVLFAGLYADGITSFTEPFKSRDHTERMMKAYGADISVDGLKVSVRPCSRLNARNIFVPSDISSAAFFIAAGLIVPDSEITILNVNINPTRDGIIEVVRKMGADISVDNIKNISGEETADITVKTSSLKAVNLNAEIMPRLIDEIPVIALCATQAEGTTVISGAGELRVKECDRLSAVATQLNKMGADIKEKEDGLIIKGKTELKGMSVESFKDHRIAMMLSVAALIADGTTDISDSSCVNISFANFYEVLKQICM